MIQLTRLNDEMIFVNADLIERVQATPDTVLVMATGRRIPVRQTLNEVLDAIRNWQATLGGLRPTPELVGPEVC